MKEKTGSASKPAQTTSVPLELGEQKLLFEDGWLEFRSRNFTDRDGVQRTWSYIERSKKRQAVVVLARTLPDVAWIFIRQFRVPLASWVWEFPAGLVDEGEGPAEAAIRELEEETGYTGSVLSQSPSLPTSAGLSTETINFVEVLAEPLGAGDRKEAAEAIEIRLVADAKLGAFLNEIASGPDLVDAKLWTWLIGRVGR